MGESKNKETSENKIIFQKMLNEADIVSKCQCDALYVINHSSLNENNIHSTNKTNK